MGKSFKENLGMGEWAPPPRLPFQPYPPACLCDTQCTNGGGSNANDYRLCLVDANDSYLCLVCQCCRCVSVSASACACRRCRVRVRGCLCVAGCCVSLLMRITLICVVTRVVRFSQREPLAFLCFVLSANV